MILPLLTLCALAAPWSVEPRVVTDFPLLAGAGARAEGPGRVQVTADVGWLPDPYLGSVNALATGLGWYDEPTADLIAAALDGALLLRPEVGWRPLPRQGLFVRGGYQLALLGGGLSGAEVLEAATGEPIPEEERAEVITASATTHMLTARAGWGWAVGEAIGVEVALGGAFTVGARTDLGLAEGGGPRSGERGAESALEPVFQEGEAYLDEVIRRYVHTPTVQVAVGWRLP